MVKVLVPGIASPQPCAWSWPIAPALSRLLPWQTPPRGPDPATVTLAVPSQRTSTWARP